MWFNQRRKTVQRCDRSSRPEQGPARRKRARSWIPSLERLEERLAPSLNPLVPDHATGFVNLLPGAGTLPNASDNTRFVMRLYGDTLHRQPDAAGLQGWIHALDSEAQTSEQVAMGIAGSHEAHRDEVTGMFRAYLGRTPDSSGLNAWTSYLDQGGTLAGLRTQLLASPEYFRRSGGTNAGFVDALYRDLLGRGAEAQGRAGWLGALAAGLNRSQVAAGIGGSPERQNQVVQSFYAYYLHREVDASGRQAWTAALRAGMSEEVLIGKLQGSAEYFVRPRAPLGAIANPLSSVNYPFTVDSQAGLAGVNHSSVAWGDYDNDGLPDILLTGGDNPYEHPLTRIYHNDGNGQFHDIQADLPGVLQSSVAWGDYDNDGYLDILLTGNQLVQGMPGNPVTRVYHNNGNGTFNDIGAGLPGVGAGSAAWADSDNDGKLDILLMGQTGPSSKLTSVFRNVSAPTPTPTVTYQVPAGTVGNVAPASGVSLGMDFDVNQEIIVTRLGVFDSGADGLQAPLTATLYNRDTQAAVARLTFNPGGSGVSKGGSVFLPLATPLVLPAGSHGTIVGDGFSGTQPYGDAGNVTPAWTTGDGGGVVSFVGNRSGTANQFPANAGTGAANRYAAATFEFLANVPGPAAPPADPAAALIPASYAVVNGSADPYLDKTYQVAGRGSPPAALQALAPLSGGLGKLTDGYLGPTTGIDAGVNALPWLGWKGGPQGGIVFDFGQPVNLTRFSLFVNNSGASLQSLPVALYDAVTADFSSDGQTYSGAATFTSSAEQKGDPAARFLSYDLNRFTGAAQTGVTARFVRLNFAAANAGASWVLLGEVRFTGVPTAAAQPNAEILSAKRVPGYQAQAPYPAVPYVVTNVNNRQVWSSPSAGNAVDYWQVYLNRGDGLLVTLQPQGSATPSNFFIRIVDSQHRDVGPARGGAFSGSVAFTAPMTGSYFVAISSSTDTSYGITPSSRSPWFRPRTPSTCCHTNSPSSPSRGFRPA